MKDINLKKIKITDLFWQEKQNLVRDIVIPFQEKILNDEIPNVEKSHAIANFRIAARLEKGEFYGMVFQDSDVAKWLEGVAYSLVTYPDENLEKRADEIIDIIEKAQQDDGYLNTFFTIKEPEHRWQNLLECHELYCAGHMMEAAVAYFDATGKRKLLNVMEKMAMHIYERFGYDKIPGIPGHQEVEIGLMRLYYTTGNKKYLELAKYFIDFRGVDIDIFQKEIDSRDWVHWGPHGINNFYQQSHLPVREQKVAVGHSVRALYMYTAMADLASATNDKELIDACETLWNNITEKQMYITGGVGATVHGESFSIDYELPNDTVYAETCASIALVFFAKKMLDIKTHGKYADIMELELYNGIISGMQLDGKQFFYVNPLEVNPNVSGVLPEYKHVLPERPGWYQCACCPPNVVRMIMSLGKYAWDEKKNTIFSHLLIGSEADLDLAKIKIETEYPWKGYAKYTISPKTSDNFELAIHVPFNSQNLKILINSVEYDYSNFSKDGYVYLKENWRENDTVELIFELPVKRMYSNTNIRENIGKVALMRGPIVYTFEGIDNGEKLQELLIPTTSDISIKQQKNGILQNMITLEFFGLRISKDTPLYSEVEPQVTKVKLEAIPYYAWGNRGLNQMKVWMNEYRTFNI